MIGYIICFISGVFVGALLTRIFDLLAFKDAKSDRKSFYDIAMSKEALRWLIGIIVVFAFLIAVVAEILDKDYQVSLALYGLIGTIVGYLFFYKKDEKN